MLNIKEISFYVDGDKESGNINVKPHSKLEVKSELENLYSRQTNIEIKDVLVKGILKEIDDGEDIEEESDEFDLGAEKSKTAKIDFDIPLEVDEDDYDLDILIEAEDDLGVKYNIEKKFTAKLSKKSHEIMFTGAELQNKEVECNRATNVEIGLINLGTKEENINLEIMNKELGLYINQKITLSEEPFDKENMFSGLIPVTINENAKAGNYPISVRAVYNNGNSEGKKTLNIIIKDCQNKISEKEEKKEIERKKKIEEPLEKVTAQVVYQQEENDPIVLIAGVGIAVGILAIIVVIVLLLKKK